MPSARPKRPLDRHSAFDDKDLQLDKFVLEDSRASWSGSTSSESRVESFTTAQTRIRQSFFSKCTPSPRWWRTAFGGILRVNYFEVYEPLDSAWERSVLIGSILFAIAAGLPLPIIGYIFGQIVNDFPPESHVLYDRLVQLLGVAVAYFVATAIYTVGFGLTAECIALKLRRKILTCLMFLDQAYLDTHDVDVDGFLTEKVDTIRAGCSEKVGIFIQSMAYFVSAAAVGFVLNAKLTGILLASVVPAFTLCFFSLASAVSDNTRAASLDNGRANSVVESALRAIKIVQAFEMVHELCQKHVLHIQASTEASSKKAAFIAVQSASAYFVGYGANALAFYLGSRFAVNGNAGSVYAVVFLILDASFVVGQFAPFLETFARALAANGLVRDLLSDHTANAGRGTYRSGGLRPVLRSADITFRQVVFHYPTRPTVDVLEGVDLDLSSGTFTAVVGISGGGKSTLVALMLGIYEFGGQIMIGGHEVRSLDLAHLRSHIAVLEQDAVLFSGSIFDNVCYGLEGQNVSESDKNTRCAQALKDANVDFLNRLPNGVHTRIGNDLQLSGGQQQRICLARALIKRPSILVLDEPTSALDAGSETAIMSALHAIAASGTTVFMIAHRLSTTLKADLIAVMNAGQVVEQGAPQELAKDGTIFRSLLDAQNTTYTADRAAADPGNEISVETSETKCMASAPHFSTIRSDNDKADAGVGWWTLIRRFAGLAQRDTGLLVLGVLSSIVGGSILLGQALVFGNLIELLNMSRQSPSFYDRANFFCLVFFVLSLIAFASYSSSGTAFGAASAEVSGRVQTHMFHKLLCLDLTWFSQAGHSVHELMAIFTKDSADLSALGGVAMGSIFAVLTSLIGSIILAHIVAWKIALVLLAAVPVMMICGYIRLRLLTLTETKYREAYAGPTSIAAEAFRKRRTVTALCIESRILGTYEQALLEPYRRVRRFILVSNTLLAFCLAATYFIYALAYWWGSRQVRNGNYTTTQFFTVLPTLLFSALSAGQIFSLSPEIARARTAARSIFKLMDARPGIMGSQSPNAKLAILASPTSGDTYHSQDEGVGLAFEGVSLQYPGALGPSLEDVSLVIRNGETVAFVGPSGAGKSSAIALLERFYDPLTGNIYFNGTNIKDIDPRTPRAQIGLVTQSSDLFPGSISDNIRLGAAPGQQIDDSDIEAVCRKCGLHDFIASLPEGYNTECGSNGSTRLSGGQKQRLTLARALIRNPRLLLLDEPTSALDSQTEAQVQEALAEAAEGRTTVIVAHRLATVRHVDRIFVFESGRVVEQGTFMELMGAGGLFAGMARAQSLA